MASRIVAMCVLALAFARGIPVAGAHANFIPDWTFKGPTLAGWKPAGEADWRVENGEIVGVPRTADGGWLLLDQSFQDVQLAASVRCEAACKPGLLLRAEAVPGGGMKGILVSYAPDDTAAYAVVIDAQGRITSRDRLRPGGGQARFVANPDGTQPNAPPARGGGPAGAAPAGPPGAPSQAGAVTRGPGR